MTFILGSSSQTRLDLLKQVKIIPDLIISADIDETPLKKEKPELYVQRIALEKCHEILKTHKEGIILTLVKFSNISEDFAKEILKNIK